ncbi:MAG TPA: methyl-accepting chemotaxis protein [Dongiaceae bacterium]|nr:methyl-accepting chemotaxis protein [Dongiaceae bacterium]
MGVHMMVEARSGAASEMGAGFAQKIAEKAGSLGVQLADAAGSIDDVAKVVTDQARQFEELRAAADAMVAANERIAGEVENAVQNADRAAAEMSASRGSLESSLADVRSLAASATAIETKIGGLRQALEQIAKVAQTIEAIAKQTNLLALNATIEAARAGDAGRGFGVVAGEVKALARQTAEATQQISDTLGQLSQQAGELSREGAEATRRAGKVESGTAAIGQVVESSARAISDIATQAGAIAADTRQIRERGTVLTDAFEGLSGGVKKSTGDLGQAKDRINHLLDVAGDLIEATADAGVETTDTPMIRLVVESAAKVGALFEQAVERGEISLADLFDERYEPVAGTEPQQVLAKFTALTDRLLPPIQEGALELDPRVVFCVAIDRNGYLPTHNRKFSQAQRKGDVVWNTANCRNRRVFNDRVGLKAGRSEKPFVVQTYRRDMGGGNFALMKDASAPIIVKGRHWGGVRCGYKV